MRLKETIVFPFDFRKKIMISKGNVFAQVHYFLQFIERINRQVIDFSSVSVAHAHSLVKGQPVYALTQPKGNNAFL